MKLLVINGAIALMYAVLGLVLNMDALVEEFTQMGTVLLAAFVVMLNACMLLYDRLMTPLVILYVKRVVPKLKFLRR